MNNQTKEATHTPTPWIAEVNGSRTRTLEDVAFFGGPNAKYIVRAVNSHEDLLAAAQNALDVIARLAMGHLGGMGEYSPALKQLRDAIAKAEGK